MHQATATIETRGRSITDVTSEIAEITRRAGVETGLAHVFVHHTSASLLIQENADPDVRHDLEAYFARLVPDGDAIYRHTDEGPDDMSAHVRSVLTATSLTIPITAGSLGLGTWQAIYLWEHRTAPHRRRITVTIQG